MKIGVKQWRSLCFTLTDQSRKFYYAKAKSLYFCASLIEFRVQKVHFLFIPQCCILLFSVNVKFSSGRLFLTKSNLFFIPLYMTSATNYSFLHIENGSKRNCEDYDGGKNQQNDGISDSKRYRDTCSVEDMPRSFIYLPGSQN